MRPLGVGGLEFGDRAIKVALVQQRLAPIGIGERDVGRAGRPSLNQ